MSNSQTQTFASALVMNQFINSSQFPNPFETRYHTNLLIHDINSGNLIGTIETFCNKANPRWIWKSRMSIIAGRRVIKKHIRYGGRLSARPRTTQFASSLVIPLAECAFKYLFKTRLWKCWVVERFIKTLCD